MMIAEGERDRLKKSERRQGSDNLNNTLVQKPFLREEKKMEWKTQKVSSARNSWNIYCVYTSLLR